MLQIPSFVFPESKNLPKPETPDVSFTMEQLLTNRREFMHMVQTAKSQENILPRIREWIQSHEYMLKKTPELAADCLLGMDVLTTQKKREDRLQAKQALREEFDLIRTMSAQAETIEQFQDYLAQQMTTYSRHLQQFKVREKEIAYTVEALKIQSVQELLQQALCHENLQLVNQLLAAYQQELPDWLEHECSVKLNWIFAKQEFEKLWTEAIKKFPYQVDQAALEACQKNTEENPVLHQTIEDMIHAKKQAVLSLQNQERASLLKMLSSLSSASAINRLNAQQNIAPKILEQYYQVAKDLDNAAQRSPAELFTKLYFNGIEQEIFQAYERGRLSARDFFCLAAQYYRRLGGEQPVEACLRCAQLKQQGEKQHLSKEEINCIQYELLSAEDMESCWIRLKNLMSN